MSSLQLAVSNLVVSYAERTLRDCQMDHSDLNEIAIAQALDTTLSVVFGILGLPTHLPVNPPEQTELEELKTALYQLGISDNDGGCVASNLGSAFEIIRGKRLKITQNGSVVLETSSERRGRGIYFTPVELAETILTSPLNQVLKNIQSIDELHSISIVDPAAGCGVFLLAAVRISSKILARRKGFKSLSPSQLRAEIASHCIFGVDIDPLAIATTRSLIRAEVGHYEWDGHELDKHLHIADSISSSIQDWAIWFPDIFPVGFSLVVTNPPWSKLRPLKHEFFEHIDQSVRLYQGTELGRYLNTHLPELVDGAWIEYAGKTLELSRHLRSSSEYTINDSSFGDADLYKYFTERSLSLLKQNGIAALLLPSGVLRAQGSTILRKLFRTQGYIKQLVEFINRQKLFDIHSMYRFCVVHFEKGIPGGIKEARFREECVRVELPSPPVRLDLNFLNVVGGRDFLIPEVRTSAERDILKRVYGRFPTPGSGDSSWVFCFKRELDMTNDADAFVSLELSKAKGYAPERDGRWGSSNDDIKLLPVYEGRMVHQFDHNAKIYISGQGRSAAWSIPCVSNRQIIPHYFVREEYATQRGWKPMARVGYCEISGHANERTLLAALIPEFAVCGNKVPVVQIQNGTNRDSLLWLALANSLVVDWIMRRFVSTTINHFYWQNIPLPPRGKTLDAELFLVKAAEILCISNYDDIEPTKWLGSRALLRAAIDVTIMDLYGIDYSDILVMLGDFPQLQSAHLRGPAGSISIAELLFKAKHAYEQGVLDLDNLEIVFDCEAQNAAAAYTPREQAKRYFSRI